MQVIRRSCANSMAWHFGSALRHHTMRKLTSARCASAPVPVPNCPAAKRRPFGGHPSRTLFEGCAPDQRESGLLRRLICAPGPSKRGVGIGVVMGVCTADGRDEGKSKPRGVENMAPGFPSASASSPCRRLGGNGRGGGISRPSEGLRCCASSAAMRAEAGRFARRPWMGPCMSITMTNLRSGTAQTRTASSCCPTVYAKCLSVVMSAKRPSSPTTRATL
mmetsp:Transcript_35135/g.100039  ORF Transcript_35135/g.100039 Transcript_35135/m.100039 type:complete len:220 (-) Transcript_35135:704-1363(-)